MATDLKISTLIPSQLPSYLLEQGPNLVAFLKAYYKWMETDGQVTEQSKNLLVNQDIDTSDLDKFYQHFRKEVLDGFPKTFSADKRLVAKKIKDLYRSKGSQASYELLFHILYGEDIDLYYPEENILRASDGRWSSGTIIRIGAPFTGNPDAVQGSVVIGQRSGARGKVRSIVTTVESGIEVRQLTLTEVSGTFENLEAVLTESNNGGVIISNIGPLVQVLFEGAGPTGGAGHQIGDSVSFTSSSGSGGTGVITSTTDDVVTFEIVDGGSGYRVDDTVITISGGSPRGGLVGAASVATISNPEYITIFTDSISGLAQTAIGYGPTYSSNSGVVSANLASSNSSTLLSVALGTSNVVVGTIASLDVTIGNYDVLPTSITALDNDVATLEISDGSGGIKGFNATFQPARLAGSISSVSVVEGGEAYNSIFPVTVSNQSRSGTINGVGTPYVTGVIESEGSYIGTKGFLSWDQRLQDNYYYQQFSYVIKSRESLSSYRDIVQDTIHPAGMKLFGQIDINNTANLQGATVQSVVFTDLIGGKFGVGVTDPFSNVSIDTLISRSLPVDSSTFSQTFGDTAVYANANGFIYVSNNNVITTYLSKPITEYLDDPVIIGTPFVVQGDGGSAFSTIVKGGSQIEIQDIIPGTSGNTTYIVNTVFSNTTFTINTQFAGGNMANGIFRYTYDGNI